MPIAELITISDYSCTISDSHGILNIRGTAGKRLPWRLRADSEVRGQRDHGRSDEVVHDAEWSNLMGQGLLMNDDIGAGQLEMAFTTPVDDEPTAGDKNEALRSIDDLIMAAKRYRSSSDYREFLSFLRRFPKVSPYNAMMVGLQKPGAKCVLTAHERTRRFDHVIRPNAQPLVVLQPFGPIKVVYDVCDVEPDLGASELPDDLTNPLRVTMSLHDLEARRFRLVDNAVAYRIRVLEAPLGSEIAGNARRSRSRSEVSRPLPGRGRPTEAVETHFDVVLSSNLDLSTSYITLVHEIAHIMCGHLGTESHELWPSRTSLGQEVEEVEAESVSFIVGSRQDSSIAMPAYLDRFLDENGEVPDVHLSRILKAAGNIEKMTESYIKTKAVAP